MQAQMSLGRTASSGTGTGLPAAASLASCCSRHSCGMGRSLGRTRPCRLAASTAAKPSLRRCSVRRPAAGQQGPRQQPLEYNRAEQAAGQLLRSAAAAVLGLALLSQLPAGATSLPVETGGEKVLCDRDCEAGLEQQPMVTLDSGLQYRDIREGTGPKPPVGFQVVVNYVARIKDKVFDNSLEKGKPYDVRVGAGQVIPGLDEGMLSMRSGGVRRLYIPGSLSFPKGLASGPGRPRVPPKSPVVFDVQLLYVPGLDEE